MLAKMSYWFHVIILGIAASELEEVLSFGAGFLGVEVTTQSWGLLVPLRDGICFSMACISSASTSASPI